MFLNIKKPNFSLQIELRNVFGINQQTCVELDMYSNLIDGEAMDVMLSIPSGEFNLTFISTINARFGARYN